MYCCCKTNKIKSFQHLAVAIKHNNRDWVPANDNGTPNDIIIPYRTPEQASKDIREYKLRKNGVLAIEYILVCSPSWFDGKTEEQIAEWEKENLRFLEEKHGRNAILGLVFHRGEQSIHGHGIVIADDGTGHLNCRKFLGGAKKMRELQDEYARYMKPFGLCRGESKITPKAKEEKAYYQTVNKGIAYATNVRPVSPEQLPSPTISDRVDPRTYASRLVNKAIAHMQRREAYLRAGLETAQQGREQLARIAQHDRQLLMEIRQNPNMISKLKEALAKEVAEKTQKQADYKKLIIAVREFFRRNIRPHDSLRMTERLGSLADFPELKHDIAFNLASEQSRQDIERTR